MFFILGFTLIAALGFFVNTEVNQDKGSVTLQGLKEATAQGGETGRCHSCPPNIREACWTCDGMIIQMYCCGCSGGPITC